MLLSAAPWPIQDMSFVLPGGAGKVQEPEFGILGGQQRRAGYLTEQEGRSS